MIDAIVLYFILVSLCGEARERQPLGYGTVSVKNQQKDEHMVTYASFNCVELEKSSTYLQFKS